MSYSDEFQERLRTDGLVSAKVHDAAYSCGLYRLDMIFGSSVGPPKQCGIDVSCGASLREVADALRALADFLDEPNV